MGVLTRPLDGEKTKRGATEGFSSLYLNAPGTLEIVKRVEEIAAKKGIRITAYVVGITSIEKLQDVIGSIRVSFSEEEIEYLEDPYQPQGVIGH